MNRARQAEITQEILEVVAGADALDRPNISDSRRVLPRSSPVRRYSSAILLWPRQGHKPETSAPSDGRCAHSSPDDGDSSRLASPRTRPAPAIVKARGYWEQVWLRLKRDRVAIAGGIFIILLFLVAFVGAPIAQTHARARPERPSSRSGTAARRQAAAGRARCRPCRIRPTGAKQLFILGADGSLGRDEFLRLLYGAQVSLEVAVGATFLAHDHRRPARRDRRLLPRLGRHDRLAADRDHDGVPVPALRHRAREHRRQPLNNITFGFLGAGRRSRSSSSSASSAGSTRRGSSERRCSRSARRSSSRRRG